MTYAVLRRHVLVALLVAALVALIPLSAPMRADAVTSSTVAAKAGAVQTVAKTTTVKKTVAKKTPKQIARALASSKYKWKTTKQWNCLHRLWHKESGWKVKAGKPTGAYGIPQAYPGKKMGKGWKTSATTQIKWGLKYIDGRYDTPCGAEKHSKKTGWY